MTIKFGYGGVGGGGLERHDSSRLIKTYLQQTLKLKLLPR